jgi:hypothetical protein
LNDYYSALPERHFPRVESSSQLIPVKLSATVFPTGILIRIDLEVDSSRRWSISELVAREEAQRICTQFGVTLPEGEDGGGT